jgi:hypothetical protein
MIVVGALGVAAFLAAQQSRQEWTIDRSSQPDMVRFGIERCRPGRRSTTKSDRPLADFQGLKPGASGRVQFEYVQDAGSLLCEGRFFMGHGSGTFQVQSNPRFVAALRDLGYEAPTDDQLYDMLLSPVSLEFARGLRDAKILVSTGELLDLRNHGITLAYIRSVREAGFPVDGHRDLIDLKNHGVAPEFLAALRRAGYKDIATNRITDLKNHGITPMYLRDLEAYGLKPGVSELIDFKNHGIQPEFLRDARELGYDFTPRELIDLKNQGVDARYLRNLRASGMRNLTAAQIVKLKIHGIE